MLEFDFLPTWYRRARQRRWWLFLKGWAWGIGVIVLAAIGTRALRHAGALETSATVTPAASPALATDTVEHSSPSNAVSRQFRGWTAAALPPITRNLFYINLESFPRDGTQLATAPVPAAGDGFWDQLAKSMACRTEEQNKRQQLVESK